MTLSLPAVRHAGRVRSVMVPPPCALGQMADLPAGRLAAEGEAEVLTAPVAVRSGHAVRYGVEPHRLRQLGPHERGDRGLDRVLRIPRLAELAGERVPTRLLPIGRVFDHEPRIDEIGVFIQRVAQ